MNEHHAPAERGLVHVRRRDDDRHALRAQLLEHLPEIAARHGVDSRRRLVEDENLRRVNERAREGELLLHPARERPRAPLHEGPEAAELEELLRSRDARLLRDAEEIGEESDVLGDA